MNANEPEKLITEALRELFQLEQETSNASNHVVEDAPAIRFACQQSVERGLKLRRLREECAHTGFLGVPLDVYIKRVAQDCGVGLLEVWSTLAKKAALSVWIGIGKDLELGTEMLRLLVRGAVAQQACGASARVAARGGPAKSTYDSLRTAPDYAAALEVTEAGYDLDRRRELDSLLALVG